MVKSAEQNEVRAPVDLDRRGLQRTSSKGKPKTMPNLILLCSYMTKDEHWPLLSVDIDILCHFILLIPGSLGNFRSRSNSFGEVAVAAVVAAAASAGNRRVQAIVDHNIKGNSTMLRFSKGDVITVMVPEARNGWLYGRLDSLST